MEYMETRRPLVEILKKTGIAIILNLILVLSYFFLYNLPFSFRTLGLGFFLIGGIFLTLAGLRDVFSSFLVKRIMNQDNMNVPGKESEYFHGFGKAGEDVFVGIIVLIVSIIVMSI